MDDFNLSSTKLNEIQNPDGFNIVWTPSNNVSSELLSKFGDYLSRFDSNENALGYITQLKSEGKTLLILTDFESLAKFENLVQIQTIYVFENENQNRRFEKKDHPKLIDIFEDINNLIERICKDILILTQRNDLPISFSSIHEIKLEQSVTSLHGFTLPFLWNQTFFHYLIKSSTVSMEELKEEMLQQCRLEYQGDQIELCRIDDFDRTCSIDNTLQWYTKDSFLYRLLNKAFRTRNIELICKFRYYIILLHQKFQDLTKEEHESPSYVYRGQSLNENTLQTLQSNVGHLISVNTIMSTTCDENLARGLIFGAENAVIFQINLQNLTPYTSKQFIDISHLSSIPDEQEILFFVGTVFSIDSVEQKTDAIWFIKLTLHDELSKHIEKLASNFQQYIATPAICLHLFMKTDDFNMIDRYYSMLTEQTFSLENNSTTMVYIYIAFSLSNLGLYKRAIHFYETAISVGKISMGSPESIVLHMIIGYLYYHVSEYDNAFNYYGIVLSFLTETDLLTSELYNHIGDVWKKINNEDIALSCYEEALKIANYRDIPSLPNIYRSIIDIQTKKENWTEVFVYEEQAKEIDYNQYHILTPTLDDQTLSECKRELEKGSNLTPIQRGDLLYTIGLCLIKKLDLLGALKHLLEARNSFLEGSPPLNRFARQLPTLFDNIAFVYLLLRDHLKALTTWKKSIDLRNNFHPR